MSRFRNRYLFLILFSLILLVFGRCLTYSFTMDDEEQVTRNSVITSESFLLKAFSGSTFYSGNDETLIGIYYRPVMIGLYGIIYRIGGLNPFYYHLFQLLLHVANTFLVFKLLSLLYRKNNLPHINLTATFLTIVFAVHPINVEPVVFVSGHETTYTFFVLTTLYLFMSKFSAANNRLFAGFVLGFFMLVSLLTKESGAIIIPLVILFHFFFNKNKVLWPIISCVVVVFLYFFLRFQIAHVAFAKNSVFPLANSPIATRIINIPLEIAFYFKTYFFPKDLIISQQWMVTKVSFGNFYLPLLLILVSVFLVLFYVLKYKDKLFLFFFLWFFASLGLVLNIIPADATVADRWMYFPQIGLLGCLGIFFPRLINKNQTVKKSTLILCVLVIVLLSVRSFLRVRDWRNGQSLFLNDLAKNQWSFDLPNNLGVEYFRQNNLDEAKKYFELSISRAPNWWISYYNLGAYYERRKNFKEAEKNYVTSIINGNYYLSYQKLIYLLLKTKNTKKALSVSQKAVSLMPNNTEFIKALTISYYLNGNTQKALGWAEYLNLKEPSFANQGLFKTIKSKGKIEL